MSEKRCPEGHWFYVWHGAESGATVYCEMWFNDREDDARTEATAGVREVFRIPGTIAGAQNPAEAVAKRVCAVMNAAEGVPTDMLADVVLTGLAARQWKDRRDRSEEAGARVGAGRLAG